MLRLQINTRFKSRILVTVESGCSTHLVTAEYSEHMIYNLRIATYRLNRNSIVYQVLEEDRLFLYLKKSATIIPKISICP